MRSEQAEATLREMLVAAGVDLEAPRHEDVARVWEVYPRFAAIDVEDAEPREEDGDGVLAQWGVSPEYEGFEVAGEHFYLDLTRQFTFYDGEEYDHMSQLECAFVFEVSDELRDVSGSDWSFDTPLEEFFAAMRAEAGYRAVQAHRCAPRELRISNGEV